MLSMDMSQAQKRHGYIRGFESFTMNRNFNHIRSYLNGLDLSINGSFNKVINQSRLKRDTKAFFDIAFKLQPVYILPDKYTPIFNRYLGKDTKTPEEFTTLIEKYALYDTPFNIPIKGRNVDLSESGIITFYADGLDETTLPIMNVEMVLATPFTDLLTVGYANQIASTQIDRTKGLVPDFHDREVIGILIEKIISYERNSHLFYEVERNRLREFRDELNLLYETGFNNNVVWSFVISTMKAEELFNYYVSLQDNDKKQFLIQIQKLFEADINLDDFMQDKDVSIDEDVLKRSIDGNLKIR